MKLLILNDEKATHEVTTEDIIRELNKRFTTPEQMEMRMDTLCVEIAIQLGAQFHHEETTDTRIFNFSKTRLTKEGFKNAVLYI